MTDASTATESDRDESPSSPTGSDETAESAEKTPEDVGELRDSIEEQYGEIEERYDEIRELLDDYNRSAMQFIRDNPGLCLAGALGTGYIVGRLASKRWLV